MKVYKKDNTFVVGNTQVGGGRYYFIFNDDNTKLRIKANKGNQMLLPTTLITELEREDGRKYENYNTFKYEMQGFLTRDAEILPSGLLYSSDGYILMGKGGVYLTVID